MSQSIVDRIASVLDSFPADPRPTELVNRDKAIAIVKELGLDVSGA